LKELVAITHDDFIVGYQSGRLGCSVNVLRVLYLVYSIKVRERHVVAEVLGWSVGLLALICLWIVGFFFLPLLLALATGVIVVATCSLISLHRIGDAVTAAALSDNAFYRLVVADHALGVAPDAERNLPELNKVVPMRYPRQARRR
jgi:uncharacterized membrane protein (Fun14 family)